nr:hypothetical protein [Tanacetum cinerariifolium]
MLRQWVGGEGGRVWHDIVKSGEEIVELGVKFTSSFVEMVGDGRDNQMLCDMFSRSIGGRVSKELEDLLGVVQHVVISNNCKDRWKWSLSEDGEFTFKELSRLIEEKILVSNNGGHEMI